MYSRQNHNQGEARLESLLDDLQSTLPRNKNNPLVGNSSSTGYREVSKSTSRTVGDGRTETNKEYEIEYLNPSNKSSVLNERLPDLQSVDLLRQTTGAGGGKNAGGYETVSSYEYKQSTETKGSLPRHELQGSSNLRKNISELDSLLDDLNHSQKTTNIEPLMSSTPYKQYSSSKHEEHKYGSVNKAPVTSEIISKYESSTSNGKPLGLDDIDGPHGYSKLLENKAPGTYQTSMYSKETTKKVIPGTTTYTTYQPYSAPITEPAGQSKVYNYSEEYRSESQNRSFRDVPRSPRSYRPSSPIRSTSPVHQPIEPKSYSSVDTYTSKTVSPGPVQKFSPSDPSRINVDDTFSTPPPGQQTVYSYKYSSETRQNTKYGAPNGYAAPVHQEQLPHRQSPFPREEIDSPGQQKPPKKLDDLMASFGDRAEYYHSEREYRSNTASNDFGDRNKNYPNEYTVPVKKPQPEVTPQAPEKLTEVKETVVTPSVAGPAVYYPPGSTTFVKKEEQMQQQGQLGRAQMKAKGKGMYKYKSKSKSKEKNSSGATVVPCCLPMCCAMPCVIM